MSMDYISTRGKAPVLSFDDVLLEGLARDGGLYLPRIWPRFSDAEITAMQGMDYESLAHTIFLPFLKDTTSQEELRGLIKQAYATFRNHLVAPLVQIDETLWLAELFHGPTLAFKDIAMQLLARLFDRVLEQQGKHITIIGATSGDTGSAAIEAFRHAKRVNLVILYPHGRISEVQRRQMTTVHAPNVHVVAVDGTFDDCQDLVKTMFQDEGLRQKYGLSAVNSINWARIMAQIPYYFSSALSLGGLTRALAYVVPTGNFGNVYAGYAARAMGLPISQFIVGSNRNDILTRFFASGEMDLKPVEPSLSPSMDIQISSNFERLLFDLMERHGSDVAARMRELRSDGILRVDHSILFEARKLFSGVRVSDVDILEEIARVYKDSGYILDPHTAVGVRAARRSQLDKSVPKVILATAHPAKFPHAVKQAIGKIPDFPEGFADLYSKKEQFHHLAADAKALQEFLNVYAKRQ